MSTKTKKAAEVVQQLAADLSAPSKMSLDEAKEFYEEVLRQRRDHDRVHRGRAERSEAAMIRVAIDLLPDVDTKGRLIAEIDLRESDIRFVLSRSLTGRDDVSFSVTRAELRALLAAVLGGSPR